MGRAWGAGAHTISCSSPLPPFSPLPSLLPSFTRLLADTLPRPHTSQPHPTRPHLQRVHPVRAARLLSQCCQALPPGLPQGPRRRVCHLQQQLAGVVCIGPPMGSTWEEGEGAGRRRRGGTQHTWGQFLWVSKPIAALHGHVQRAIALLTCKLLWVPGGRHNPPPPPYDPPYPQHPRPFHTHSPAGMTALSPASSRPVTGLAPATL